VFVIGVGLMLLGWIVLIFVLLSVALVVGDCWFSSLSLFEGICVF